ncbi:hypothetical protein A6X21_04435 [Planctopirus hydrillae]|uniref:Uncharacterized protein n=1 Tax=Planctopirus hydrillae TaxID=1841610 RepID=A0A1C3ENX3_9PLAN|nr:hypothetical protein A6X21_04435 [Planctopirus hydrillae]
MEIAWHPGQNWPIVRSRCTESDDWQQDDNGHWTNRLTIMLSKDLTHRRDFEEPSAERIYGKPAGTVDPSIRQD